MHMQDHLYKDYVAQEGAHEKVVGELKQATANANEELLAAQKKAQALQALV